MTTVTDETIEGTGWGLTHALARENAVAQVEEQLGTAADIDRFTWGVSEMRVLNGYLYTLVQDFTYQL